MDSVDSSFDFSKLPKPPVYAKTNYNVFIIAMLAIIFIISSISYMNLSRNIRVNQITDPEVQDKLNNSINYSLWVMILTGITLFVYGYMLVKNKH